MSTPITDHTAGGGGEEPLSLSRIKDAISYHAHGCENGYARVPVMHLLNWRHGLAAALAAHPTGPEKAEPVAGAKDLTALSKAATQGEWHDASWGHSDQGIISQNGASFIGTHDSDLSGRPHPGKANAAFIVALVNAWRAGRLSAAKADPNESVVIRDPLVEIAPDARKDKEPCGECRIRPGETCDICGAKGVVDIQKLRQLCGMLGDLSASEHSKNLFAAVKILEAAR